MRDVHYNERYACGKGPNNIKWNTCLIYLSSLY